MILLQEVQLPSIHFKGAILHKVDVPHLWKHWQGDSISLKS
jgi:hypothetical protein